MEMSLKTQLSIQSLRCKFIAQNVTSEFLRPGPIREINELSINIVKFPERLNVTNVFYTLYETRT